MYRTEALYRGSLGKKTNTVQSLPDEIRILTEKSEFASFVLCFHFYVAIGLDATYVHRRTIPAPRTAFMNSFFYAAIPAIEEK